MQIQIHAEVRKKKKSNLVHTTGFIRYIKCQKTEKPIHLKVFRSKKTRGRKYDGKNLRRLPMPETANMVFKSDSIGLLELDHSVVRMSKGILN